MYRQVLIVFVFFGAVAAWSQVEPDASGGVVTPENDQMMMPPPVSGIAYPSAGKDETRSNYLAGGVGFTAAFDDNVLAGATVHPTTDRIYSILPTISLDQKTPRQNRSFSYSAGFTFYDPTTALNEVDQIGDFQYDYRFNARLALSVRDSVLQTSDVFSAPTELTGGQVSGSAGTPDVIAPFGSRITNSGEVGLTYQFGLNGMVGGGGTTDLLNYLHTSQVPDLYNSVDNSGTVFYSRRISRTQYIGALYLYRHIYTYPVDSVTDTNTSSIFYTLFLKNSISISAVAGGEYSNATESGVRAAHAWTPAITASVGWQAKHGSLAVRYSRTVSAGGGLLGSYTATTASGTAGWQLTKTWSFGVSGDYALNKNETPIQFSSTAGGHSIAGTVSISRSFREHYAINAGYDRLHESYSGIQAISNDPDSNREFITISYHFQRPLGR